MGKERECVPFEEQKESKNPDLFWRQPQKSQRIEELWSGSKFRTKWTKACKEDGSRDSRYIIHKFPYDPIIQFLIYLTFRILRHIYN
jgi:hypothetical protein